MPIRTSLSVAAVFLSLSGGCADAARRADDAGNPSGDAALDAVAIDAASDDASAPVDGSDSSVIEDASVDATPEDAANDAAPVDRSFEIAFRGVLGNDDAVCGAEFAGFGPSMSQAVTLKDFRFYVHGVELIRDDDVVVPLTIEDHAPFQNAGVALLDFEDKTGDCINGTTEMNTVVRGHAPEGTYTGIRFILGVPLDQNHQDRSVAAAPLDLSQLFWSWAGGYLFARIDLFTTAVDAGPRATFSVHLASTGCNGSPSSMPSTQCTYQNRPTIELSDFDPDADVILVDPKAVVEGVDLTVNTPATGIGCMSARTDPDCDVVMPRLGVDFGTSTASQVLFRVAH
jgi:uncharacterized repeat protein (TIGR04052 family)